MAAMVTPTRGWGVLFVDINREEVNDAFSDAFAPDAIEGFRYRELSVEEGEIFARMFDNSRIEVGNAGQLRHSSLLRDERCLCFSKSLRRR